jgi:MarR family transcriptional regulator, organic hydroperoxide resistance regulator
VTKAPSRTKLANDIVQAYLELGDTLRMAALPSWITAELNLSQLKAIVLLEHHGALTVSELAKLLGMGNPAASILVQQLVQQGLVERSEDVKDRRRTFVRATARGAGLIASRREHIQTNLRRWLNQLGDDELASLQHGLSALLRVVQAEQAQEIQAAPELAQKHS